MNVLVTGANGQLGHCLKHIVDKHGNGHANHTSVDKNYYIFASREDLDITNKETVEKYFIDNKINVVINCAAYTAVDLAEDKMEDAFRINSLGPEVLAFASKSVGGVLIHISTDYVFNGLKNGKYDEDDEASPMNVYGWSKLEGERKIIESGCYYQIFRTSWLYSEYGKNFVKTMLRLMDEREEIKVVADQTGCPTYAMDLADFLYRLIENNNSENRNLSKSGIYHYSNSGQTTWFGFTREINNLRMELDNNWDKVIYLIPCSTEEYPTKAKRPKQSVFDLTKINEVFNEKPDKWYNALRRCLTNLIKEEGD